MDLDLVNAWGSSFSGGSRTTEQEIRAALRDLAALPHMRPELRDLFRIWADPAVTSGEVLVALRATLEALRDVERLVSGAEGARGDA